MGERYRFVLLNRISPAEFAHLSNNLPLEIGRMPCTKNQLVIELLEIEDSISMGDPLRRC